MGAMAADGAPTAKKQKKVKQPIEAVPEGVEAHAGHSRLARALGSVDWHTREKGVQALTRFLQRKTQLPERDMLKIWKGLFYAFWHSDKAPVQEELAERLATVLTDLQPQVAHLYFTCFVLTMRREWFGIDRLRLDKFLMLIRKFMCRMFKLLADSKWKLSLVSQYMDYIRDHVLLPSDNYRSLGITYHFADIFLPELKRMVALAVEGGANAARAVPSSEAVMALVQPFVNALAAADDAPMLVRIKEGVFDALMQELRSPDESDVLRNLDAGKLARSMFDLGTKPEMRSRNRQALYSISSAMERAKAKRQRTQQEQGHAAPSKPAAAAAAGLVSPAAVETGQKAAAALSNGAALSGGAAAGGKKKRKAAQMQLDGDAADVAGPSGQDGHATMAPGKPSKATTVAGAGAATAKAAAPAEAGPSHAAGHDSAAGVQGSTSEGKKKGKLLAAKQVPQASVREAGQQGQGQGQPQAARSVAVLKPQQPPKSALKGAKATGADAQATGGKKRDANVAFAFAPGTASAGSTPQMASKADAGSGQKGLSNAGAKTAPPAGAASASAKKSVQINLRKNLYFEFGGPVPPAEVRTPQTARSKGGILKKVTGAIPRSAPAKSKGGNAAGGHKLPKGSSSADRAQQGRPNQGSGGKSGRARAALFF